MPFVANSEIVESEPAEPSVLKKYAATRQEMKRFREEEALNWGRTFREVKYMMANKKLKYAM